MRSLTLAILPATAFLIANCTTAPNAPSPQSDLGWLLGCWATPTGTVEEWIVWDEERLMGEGRSPRRDGTTFNEFLTITSTANGYVYTAEPEGMGSTDFHESDRDTLQITFLNADHDYPQRIQYMRDGDQLTATISLADGSRPASWAFSRCPSEN
ncbi:DUF6265 family protein [Ponticaulis koreensis]|uniref:DUF6265 family protein n=1 Tax=Ponticaulis koreensis TaxID=1123045 RepID=UPI0003B6E983|nr:DUF6265 family protein [Ponticaulis koreensis]